MAHTPPGETVYHGARCCCVRLPQATEREPPRYAIMAHGGTTVLGELRWSPSLGKWCFVPGAGTAWTSTTLSEISVWLRRLNRPLETTPH